MTSGDHRSPQRYHHLVNSQNHVIILFLLYHRTCQMQLNMICQAAEPGRESQWYCTAGDAMLKGHC